jgi:hypothetical protein
MKGDFTRDSFDPTRHFSRVLMQQGRVQLDADWNEQTSILLHYVRTLAMDILGPHAGPVADMGFDIITADTVKGWANPSDEWQKIEPDEARRKLLQDAVENGRDALIDTGRYYVHGFLVENDRPILYSEQTGYPFTPEMELDKLQGKELLVYLDVWERHITYVQDDRIREVALGGADTCTRAQVVWQVKVLTRANQEVFDCSSLDGLLERADLPRLRARARRSTPSPELCSVAPEAKYRGLENQLYRVEVHQGGRVTATSVPTFKWSRENGSVAFPIVSLSGNTAVVTSLGRDACTHLKQGDWVELCDDVLALRGEPGQLAQVDTVDAETLKITLKWPDGAIDLPGYAANAVPDTHPLLRRWDYVGDLAKYQGALPIAESSDASTGWIALEQGIEIWFAAGGDYRSGDYWLIPARVATGDVEWPQELDVHGVPQADSPAAVVPNGPAHYYAPLYHFNDGQTEDCRCRISPLPCAPQG